MDLLGAARLGSTRYSVPSELVGREVELLVDGGDVGVLHRAAEVALHRRRGYFPLCLAASKIDTPALSRYIVIYR